MTRPLTLGPVEFAGLESPAEIQFGGRQRLAIHQFPGGGRTIDCLGSEDGPIQWTGILSGSNAYDRIRLLDGLRIAGAPVRLCWGNLTYTVIISECSFIYRQVYWVDYSISCIPSSPPQISNPEPTNAATSAAIVDLAMAQALVDQLNTSQPVSANFDANLPTLQNYILSIDPLMKGMFPMSAEAISVCAAMAYLPTALGFLHRSELAKRL